MSPHSVGQAVMLILFSPFILAFTIHLFCERMVYRKIRKIGVAGFGRLVSCKKRYALSILSLLLPEYNPIIEFYYADKRYEIRAMGFFRFPPGEVGDEIAIIFSEEYFDKVVITDKDMLGNYIVRIICGFASCAYIAYLFWFLLP